MLKNTPPPEGRGHKGLGYSSIFNKFILESKALVKAVLSVSTCSLENPIDSIAILHHTFGILYLPQ